MPFNHQTASKKTRENSRAGQASDSSYMDAGIILQTTDSQIVEAQSWRYKKNASSPAPSLPVVSHTNTWILKITFQEWKGIIKIFQSVVCKPENIVLILICYTLFSYQCSKPRSVDSSSNKPGVSVTELQISVNSATAVPLQHTPQAVQRWETGAGLVT